jgi:hypothetical protein
MNVYRLQYRERGYITPQNSYNVLAEDLESALPIGNKHATRDYPGMVMECCGVEEIARDVIANPRAIKKAA